MTTTPEENKEQRQEGVFYSEEHIERMGWSECCEKCHDVHFEKTYPAHTAYYACTNLNCECHKEQNKQDLTSFLESERKEFEDSFLAKEGGQTVTRTGIGRIWYEEFGLKDFLSSHDTRLLAWVREVIETAPAWGLSTENEAKDKNYKPDNISKKDLLSLLSLPDNK